MTRQEEIEQTAKENASDLLDRHWFENGAKWADQHPAWISVEESLPKISALMGCGDGDDWFEQEFDKATVRGIQSEPVLTLRVDGEVSIHWLTTNDDLELVWGGYNGTLSVSVKGSAITHWMPIPPPPVTKGGAS